MVADSDGSCMQVSFHDNDWQEIANVASIYKSHVGLELEVHGMPGHLHGLVFPEGVHGHSSKHCEGYEDSGDAAQHGQPRQLLEGRYEHQWGSGYRACYHRKVERAKTQYLTCSHTGTPSALMLLMFVV